MFRQSPALAAAIVLTLALGIGANTAIFSVVDSVLLRPLAFRDPARLVAIWDNYAGQPKLGVSPAEFERWRQQTDLFESAGIYRYVGVGRDLNLTSGVQPARVHTTWASASLFPTLGVRPSAGRFFTAGEAASPVALLSYKLWRERFGGDPGVIGSPIQLSSLPGSALSWSQKAFTVIGVLPSDFQVAPWADVWMPDGQAADEATNPVRHAFGVVARLKPGVSAHQVSTRLDAIGRELRRDHPATSNGFGFVVTDLQNDLAGSLRPALLVLLGAVTLVLLIACVNVANLLLARSVAHRHEMAVRIALGAGRWRIVRDSLRQSLELAAAGGAAGLLVAYLGLNMLLRFVPPDSIDPSIIRLNFSTLFFLLAASLATGLIFGVAPAYAASRQDPNEGLRESGRSVAHASRGGRNALVVTEFALASSLLLGAGLFLASFARLLRVDPGFRPEHVLTMRFTLPQQSYSDDQKLRAFHDRLQLRLRALPGVADVGLTNALPLGSTRGNTIRFTVPGSPGMHGDILPMAQNCLTTPDYFRTLGVPLIAGRIYEPRDIGQPYLVVNQTMARTFWPGENPVGKRLITGPWGSNQSWSTVIGVVGDVKQFGLDSDATNDFYALWYGGTYLLVRTTSDPLALASAVRRELQAIDPAVPVSEVASMEQMVNASSGSRRFTTVLLSVFAGLALMLALLGIYSVMSWSVAQRRQEIGVRMALGADALEIFRLILGRALGLSAIGLAIGLIGTLALSRILASLLFQINPHDPWILSGLSVTMLFVTAAACYLPAIRATEVDPIETLRAE